MDAELYRGREQTYSKHLFLQRYLERVAFHIAYSQSDFVYVDGFSGPWKAAAESLEDTSFMIAIRKLQYVREALGKQRKSPRIRCLFIEAGKRRFEALQRATRAVDRLETTAMCGEFESLIPDVMRFIGRGFSLVFIDPTGWEGFSMEKMKPILKRQSGEVIVNFMYDYINRFLNDIRAETESSFDRLFGTNEWRFLRNTEDNEQIIHYYARQLQLHGGFRFVTFTPILKTLADRPYFYLIYCTRNIRGLIEFREAEKKSIIDQQRIRDAAQQTVRIKRTGQSELYSAADFGTSDVFDEQRRKQLAEAKTRFASELGPGSRMTYGVLLGKLLVLPFVWESDVKQMISNSCERRSLIVDGLSGRQRVPRLHSMLRGL